MSSLMQGPVHSTEGQMLSGDSLMSQNPDPQEHHDCPVSSSRNKRDFVCIGD